MWTLTKSFSFEAAHKLPHHDGKCARLHGHSWRGRLIVRGDTLREHTAQDGMLIDYGIVGSIIKPLVEEKLDHYYLNESLGLESPTSEQVALVVYREVVARIRRLKTEDFRLWDGISIVAVEIDETCTSSCRFEI